MNRRKNCALINPNNGIEASKSFLLSDKKKENVIYVHILCKTECKPYYTGTVSKMKNDCEYPEIKDPIFELIKKIPEDYKQVCSTSLSYIHRTW